MPAQLGCVTTGFLVLTNGAGLPKELSADELRFTTAIDGQLGIGQKVVGIHRFNDLAVLDLGAGYEANTLFGNMAVEPSAYRSAATIFKFD